MDLVEMHEAFAAQILSNMKAFASPKFAAEELGRSAPLGQIDLERFNVNGGSIALGHPFGATGGRVTIQLLEELRSRSLNFGLITVCAAGELASQWSLSVSSPQRSRGLRNHHQGQVICQGLVADVLIERQQNSVVHPVG
jgi:acetyl-CoA acyltransferase